MDTNCFFMQGAAGDMSVKTSAEDNIDPNDPRLDPANVNPVVTKLLVETMNVTKEKAVEEQVNMVRNEGKMENFGKRLGETVVELAKNTATSVPENPSVKGQYKDFSFESRVNFQSPVVLAMFRRGFFPELANASVVEVADNMVNTRLSVILINDELALVGGSGEFFSDHANMIKARSQATKTLFVGYCNGHNMYFPTIQGASQGGYGADPTVSWVSLGAGERMMNEALIIIFEELGSLTREVQGG